MNGIEIREAIPADASSIIAYMKKIGGESDNLTYGAEGRDVTVEKESAILENIHNDKHSVFFCAWKGSELVGTANLSGMPRRMSHRAGMGISVIKAEWNHGVGTKLMERLINYAKENGIELINLEVRSDNTAAIHLYEKFGFKKTGTIPAFFKVGSAYVDFDIMNLDLRQTTSQFVGIK